MDEHTYSNTKAAVNLYHMLDTPEYAPYKDKARKILSKWFQYSSAVMSIPNADVCRGSLDLWRAHFLQLVDKRQFPEVVRSHVHCVITAQYRKCCRAVPRVKLTHIVVSTSFGPFHLNIEMHKEEDMWVGVCRELGTSQFDAKWAICKQKLIDAMILNLETLHDVGEIERTLHIKRAVIQTSESKS
jgi:hypothetical protein